MGIRENKVEKYLDSEVKKLGGITRKWVSPGRDGVPDRIVIIRGNVMLVEVKTLDGKITQVQQREHQRLEDAGAKVFTVYGEQGVDLFLRHYKVLKIQVYACGKPIPGGKGNTNANTGCGEFNCGPCNKFIYGD